ncbi:MAG TPA: MnhB domain-containing protein [Solirubrobacteraceae bacterium]|nr:MnhB domain-containing protein [Solirubrobacteraceae bacterium]
MSLLIQTLARVMLAPILMVALAVLVKGYADVGDGFAAGAIAALAILLQYVAFGREETERRLPIRLLPAGAFVAMLLALTIAAAPMIAGEALLTYPPGAGEEAIHLGTLELIGAFAFDVTIFVLVVGAALGIIHAIAREAEHVEAESP